jgi:hypothetical protein
MRASGASSALLGMPRSLCGSGPGWAIEEMLRRAEQAVPQRIAQFRVTAPCADWNGVWSLVEK